MTEMTTMIIKCITLWQPWASLIVDKRKPVETRPWKTKYRGVLAIHAGLHVDRQACIKFKYNQKTIPRGAVLGIATVMNCVQFPDPSIVEDDYGDYTAGRFGWVLDFVHKFEKPIPAKGNRMLWNWEVPKEIIARKNVISIGHDQEITILTKEQFWDEDN